VRELNFIAYTIEANLCGISPKDDLVLVVNQAYSQKSVHVNIGDDRENCCSVYCGFGFGIPPPNIWEFFRMCAYL